MELNIYLITFSFSYLFSQRRKELVMREDNVVYDPILSNSVSALLTAFVSIELSPGTSVIGSAGSAAETVIAVDQGRMNENAISSATDTQTATVSFEEKFHYRRPMYACLRYWYGKPLYDIQFKVRKLLFEIFYLEFFN